MLNWVSLEFLGGTFSLFIKIVNKCLIYNFFESLVVLAVVLPSIQLVTSLLMLWLIRSDIIINQNHKQMKILKSIAFVFLSSMIIFSCCSSDEPESICDESTSEFQSLFQSMIASGHSDDVTFDTEIHEYTFVLSADKELCKIGYQSVDEIESTAYLMEIVDNSSNTTIYSDSHVFSSSNNSYVTPSTTIELKSGVSYSIKRIQTDWDPYISYTIGRLARKETMAFPYSSGIMTITGADFYQNGGPLTDMAVPYIDLIFR